MNVPAAFSGVPVVLFDGENHEEITKALDMKVGDGIVMLPGQQILLRGSQLDEFKAEWNGGPR